MTTPYSGVNSGNIQNGVVGLVRNLTDLLAAIQLEHIKLSAFSDTQLEQAGITANDLQYLKTALADANAIAQITFTGLPPSTYPQPASTYVYFNSMTQLIGP